MTALQAFLASISESEAFGAVESEGKEARSSASGDEDLSGRCQVPSQLYD